MHTFSEDRLKKHMYIDKLLDLYTASMHYNYAGQLSHHAITLLALETICERALNAQASLHVKLIILPFNWPSSSNAMSNIRLFQRVVISVVA